MAKKNLTTETNATYAQFFVYLLCVMIGSVCTNERNSFSIYIIWFNKLIEANVVACLFYFCFKQFTIYSCHI